MEKRVRAIVIRNRKILVIERRLPNESYLVFPGGGVELKDRSERIALKRECIEEAGVNIDILSKVWERTFCKQTEIFYLCDIGNQKIQKGNGPEYDKNNLNYKGTHKPKWISLKKLKNYDLKPTELKNFLIKLNEKAELLIQRDNSHNFNNKERKFNGLLIGGKKKIFYKISDEISYKKEIAGYKKIKKFYPVPKIINYFNFKKAGVIFFEFENSIKKNQGLLNDLSTLQSPLFLKRYNKILNLYRKIFLKSLKKIKKSENSIFFQERILTRVKKYYDENFLNSFERVIVNFNGIKLKLYPKKIIKELELFFDEKEKNRWGVISQGDPISLNIGIKPIFFDFHVSGYNYLMAEFATFFWSNLALDDYFALIYNPNSYINHEKSFEQLNKVQCQKNILNYKINSIRKKILILYLKKVINPCLEAIKQKEKNYEWYKEFKNFIAMRIISVFNLKDMSRKDQLLSLAYLQLFFENNITDTKTLIKIFLK